MNILSLPRKFQLLFRQLIRQPNYYEHQRLLLRKYHEEQKLLLGKLLIEEIKKKKNLNSLADVEFKTFSEWGDDGIIQFLIHNIDIPHKTFIEFGVADYTESNTRFLLMNNNWSGLIMDASEENILKIKNSEYYYKYDLTAKYIFIDCKNINDLISSQGFDEEVGILHIDIDGNDYWIWRAINVITPIIVIMEYNSVLGIDRAITVPYDEKFQRTRAHFSNLYFGASLRSLHRLGNEKGYAFIGCNSAGNNAYFVRKDKLNNNVKEVSLEEGYVLSKFRESRDMNGNLTHVQGENRLNAIKGMWIYNIETDALEEL